MNDPRSVPVQAKDPATPLSRATALLQAGRNPEALRAFRAAVAADPADALALGHLGTMLSLMGHVAEAEPVLRRALAMDPTAPEVEHALALTLLAQGRFAEAGPFYRIRHRVPGLEMTPLPTLPFPRWAGEDLAGKRIAIFREGGFGDQIQFVRFLPMLQAMGARVMLFADPDLVRLFAFSFPGVEVIATRGAVEFDDPDYWAMTSDLPGDLGVTLETLPAAPYLRTPETRPRDGGFRIGLKTAGNPKYRNDRWRSLGERDAAALRSRLPGEIVSLEPRDTGSRDFADTAAVVEAVDLVVTTDTSIAHVAGALGKRCLVLVGGFASDWRWMQGRGDSPWYPNTRIHRGEANGTWQSAIRRLAADARQIAGEYTR